MIRLSNINYSIGARELLKDINLIINPGQRSAFLGVNGSGKTTLLKIMNGELDADSGDILKPNNFRIGYLPQEITETGTGVVLEEVKSGREDILTLEKKLEEIHDSFDTGSRKAEEINIKRLGDLEAEFNSMDGYDLERRSKKVLFGLGFSSNDLERKISDLSGGWQMRVYLAKLLISEPDLLLLDEPTNHLDIRAIEWLEKFLGNFKGSIIVVTHDRFFIDRVTENIFELHCKNLFFFKGGYDFFINKKKENEEIAIKKAKELLKKKEHLERFINRFRYKATKARQVKSREKEYDKLEDMELYSTPDFLRFDIKIARDTYLDVIDTKGLFFRYEEEWVLKNIDLKISKGERIALIGENGSGKSTLARLISGELKQQKGDLIIGERTDIGFYAQHQAIVLDPSSTIFDVVSSRVPESDQTVIRTVLGLFGFSGDEIYKRIGVLSGGEKSRVSLSRILLTPNNFLIMDEPTNHLDSISRDALESALINYGGTMLLISHDRYFLDKIVTRVIELRDGNLYDYKGNYSYYLSKKEEMLSTEVFSNEINGKRSGRNMRAERKLRALSRQEVSAERGRLRSKIELLESGISILEQKKNELEKTMVDPATYKDTSLISPLQKKYAEVTRQLEGLYADWEKFERQMGKLISKLDKG